MEMYIAHIHTHTPLMDSGLRAEEPLNNRGDDNYPHGRELK